MPKIIKYLAILAVVFALFQFSIFIRIRIINLDLPKGKVVFSSPIDGDDEIYTMNINGLGLKQLTKNSETIADSAIDSDPSFSYDGKKIVFTSGRQGQDIEFIYNSEGRPVGTQSAKTGTSDVYIMDLDGRNQTPVTYKGKVYLYPFFSPDGKRIIFKANLDQWQTRMMNIDGSDERILNIGIGQCKFSSDGRKIFDNFQHGLSVMNIDGTNRTKLTSLTDIADFDIYLDKEIVFFTRENKNKLSADVYTVFRFYKMKTDSYELEEFYRLESERGVPGFLFDFRYTPNGKQIILLASFYKEENKNIYSLDIKNRTLTNLSEEKERWRNILSLTFTPDGKRIIFTADIYPKVYRTTLILHNLKSYIKYFSLRKKSPYYDNKYICIMDIDGKNFRKIAKLPIGSEFGRDFIHWEK